MSTKNDPGAFDCYANAAPDEPMFVLLGRDPVAGFVVAFWEELRKATGANVAGDKQLVDAAACRRAMLAWADKLSKDTDLVYEKFNQLMGRP